MTGLVLSGPAIALEPHEQTIEQSIEAGAAPDAAFLRCGAFYYAHLWWDASKPFLTDPERALYDANMSTALTQTNFVRSERTDADVDAINAGIKRDLRPYIVSYLKRIERNLEANGARADDLIRADQAFCDGFIAS